MFFCPEQDFTAQINADVRIQQQTMDGFGASDAFLNEQDEQLTTADADLFFDPVLGIGLSLLRCGIDEGGGIMSFFSNPTLAAARGARIVGVPWTAAAAQKDNGSLTNGGHLLVGSYGAWSDTLTGFQGVLQSNSGVNMYALEVQNEPDFSASYHSMLYTTAEMTAFVKVIGPKLAVMSPRPLLFMPSTANWSLVQGYANDTIGDGTAAPYLDGLSGHTYAGPITAPLTGIGTRRVWMTEASYFTAFDPTITQAMVTAADIHTALTVANANAYIYFWLINKNQDNEALIGNGTNVPPSQTALDKTLTKRLWAFGNWSKFVRPNAIRLTTTGSISGVSITAFWHPTSLVCVVVCINTNTNPITFKVRVAGMTSRTATPYVTSATFDLAAQPAIPVAEGGLFSAYLPATSITSFVGGLSTGPTLALGTLTFTASPDHASVIYYSAQLRVSGSTVVIDSFNMGTPTPIGGVITVDLSSWLGTHAAGSYTISVLTVTALNSTDSVTTSPFTLPLVPVDPNAYPTLILSDTPVAYYRLDDTVGAISALNAASSSYIGTVQGGLTFGQTSINGAGTAALFNGVNGTGLLIAVPPPISASVTFEGWVKLLGAGANAYSFLWSSGVTVGYPFVVAVVSDGVNPANSLQIYLNVGSNAPGWIPTGHVVASSAWEYVAVTWDGTNLIAYANGISVFTTAAYSGSTLVNIGSTNGSRAIGSDASLTSPTNPFNGVLDDVALYNYALTSTQVLAHYHKKVP